jgi:hypothetical protein
MIYVEYLRLLKKLQRYMFLTGRSEVVLIGTDYITLHTSISVALKTVTASALQATLAE